MDLNLTNLKDLAYICQLAREALEPEYGLPEEKTWIERIEKYRKLLEDEIKRLESDGSQPDFRNPDEKP
jgi:hypothetical protein